MRKLFTIIIITLLIAIAASWATTVAYGHTNDSLQLNGTINDGILVEAAPPETAPAVTLFGSAISSVTPGDLFFIDSTNVTQDISITMTLTNADALVHYLKYMTLKVVVYYEVAPGQWQKAQMIDGSAFRDIFITMRNGLVTFDLPGMARYRVSIESGSFNCYPANGNNTDISPLFFLEAESI